MQLSMNTSVWYLEQHGETYRQEMRRQSYQEWLRQMAEKPKKMNFLSRVSVQLPVFTIPVHKK
jgi:hypothetical protein